MDTAVSYTKSTKIRFLKDPPGFPEFKAGEVYSLSGPSAYRWVRRGLAEPVLKHAKRENQSVETPENASAGGTQSKPAE